ncbi:hypothetical protein evm_005669 [Chilo suppressalis]|nr:hypothetical protein evm_005669 [Chilo suppressalis]
MDKELLFCGIMAMAIPFCNAFYDDIFDNWYSSDDGIINTEEIDIVRIKKFHLNEDNPNHNDRIALKKETIDESGDKENVEKLYDDKDLFVLHELYVSNSNETNVYSAGIGELKDSVRVLMNADVIASNGTDKEINSIKRKNANDKTKPNEYEEGDSVFTDEYDHLMG